MTNTAIHPFFVEDGKRVCFEPARIGDELVAALNKLDDRGGWRVTEIMEDHYLRPVEISRCNSHSITISRTYPNKERGQARLHVHARPKNCYRLPSLTECSFDPKRPVAAIARDIFRKIETPAEEIAAAYQAEVDADNKKAAEHTALLDRLARMTGKPLHSNGSGYNYFSVGPFDCTVDENGTMRTRQYTYLSEQDLEALQRAFKAPDSSAVPVCNACGSDQVTADANAMWNRETGEWEVTDIFDKGHYCSGCESSDARFDWSEHEPEGAA